MERAKGALDRHFARLDKSKDSSISRAELLVVHNPAMRPLWDRNGRPLRVRERPEPR